MNAVLFIAAPIFALIAAGFFAGRGGFLTPEDAHGLNRFVFLFAMPAATFAFAAGSPPPTLAAAPFALSYLVVAVFAMAAGFAIGRFVFKLTPAAAGVHAYCGVLANAVFLGLPIALSVEGWATPYLVLMLMEGGVIVTLGAALSALPDATGREGANVAQSLRMAARGVIRNPIILGLVAGFGLSFSGLALPAPAMTFFELLAAAAAPAALFSLGATLSERGAEPSGKGQGEAANIAAIAVIKLAVLPAGAWLLASRFADPPDAWMGALLLFTSLPVGAMVYVQATRRGIYTGVAAAALGVTTILSVITVSTVLAVFA
ncbi:MAG: AEC family transporter [Pseudomonadota bacterium]